MCRLMYRIIKMHYAYQRVPCLKTEIPIISLYGICLIYLHIAKLTRIGENSIDNTLFLYDFP